MPLSVLLVVLTESCSGSTIDVNAPDASAGAAGRSATGGRGGFDMGSTGGAGGSTTGGGGFGGDLMPGPVDVRRVDVECITSCTQPGGQFCGRISDKCAGSLDCGNCTQEGFVCGGSGIPNLCGAPRDSGRCEPIECQQPGGSYCGVIGGGCGDQIDCGECTSPTACGGGGTPGVCGIPDNGDCVRTVCKSPSRAFCGEVGNGCGGTLDCGTCAADQGCGERVAHVCNRPCPLCKQVAHCDSGAPTTITGIALSPAMSGPHPLRGAVVYIPNLAPGARLPPIADGPSCQSCSSILPDDVVAAAVTDAGGRFTLVDVPAGNGIPLVVQLGPWRMQTSIDVLPCANSVIPDGKVRLPRSQQEGDIPLTAIVTGDPDHLECLFRKLGIADSEFTNPSGTGRFHLYRGAGAIIDANTPDSVALKGSPTSNGDFARYHQVLFPCQGTAPAETPEALAHFTTYANAGGRVFLSHYSHTWLSQNDTFRGIGTWTPQALNPPGPANADVLTTTETGRAFATWLGLVGALSRQTPPQFQISEPRAVLGALDPNQGGEPWLSLPSSPTNSTITDVVRVPAPVAASPDAACGRIIFSDFHPTATPSPAAQFPSECGPDWELTNEEKALEFMLFDLFACQGLSIPPKEPPPPKAPPPPPPRPPFPPPPTAR